MTFWVRGWWVKLGDFEEKAIVVVEVRGVDKTRVGDRLASDKRVNARYPVIPF
jgi:hypothetical protein